MGKNHARVYRDIPDVELVALADCDEEVAEQLSKLYHVPTYLSAEEMLAYEDVDAVSVVVPTYLHHDVALSILERNCHVLVEKPIAGSLPEAQHLIQIAEKHNRVLMVGHIERFNPAVIELKQRLTRGELGQIYAIHTRRLGPFPSRIQDVGVIMDLAPHDLDVMRYLTDCEVTSVYADTRQKIHHTHEDLLNGILCFSDGTVGLMEINWLTPTKIRELYVTGERGMFQMNYITQDLWFYENAETQGEWPALSVLRGVREGTVTKYPIIKKEPLRVELEYFLDCVTGKQICEINGREALAVLSLALELKEKAAAEDGKERVLK
jgi:predicted dehydrogenase